ncbi:MAG TPA: TetR family transcriptional regulator [Pseudonocardia sp.]
MSDAHCGFRRARRPEQVEARRAAILDAAVALLRERPISEISLRELSARVGLAKSNVLRYFDSREAIFLEVLDQFWTEWLDDLQVRLAEPGPAGADFARERELAGILAAELAARPLLCELIASMGGVLERNISPDFARGFKQRAMANTARLAALAEGWLPGLTAAGAAHFAAMVGVVIGGVWPYVNPTEAVAAAIAELGCPSIRDLFADMLTDALANQLVGLVVRARAGSEPVGFR